MVGTVAIRALQAQLERWSFEPHGDPLTEAELVAAEALAGDSFPEDFRWFCLTYGSGYAGRSGLSIELSGGGVIEFDRIGDAHGIRTRSYLPDPPLPPGLVPCGSTLMGDMFFLRLGPPHNGRVWYWIHDDAFAPNHGLTNTVAENFTELLASSRPISTEP